MDESTLLIRTFKYRLYPSKSQEENLFRVLNACRGLYNMVLAERKYTWEHKGRSITHRELEELGKRYRETFPYAQQVLSQTVQSVIKQVDDAFKRFFKRVKGGETPGYPRFKTFNRFHSFEFKQYGTGCKLDGRRVRLYGIGRVAVRWHRELEGKIKTARVLYQAGQWFICFACEVPKKQTVTSSWAVGVDVGISSLIATSDGETVPNPNYYREAQQELRKEQRRVERKRKGGNNQRKARKRVARLHQHIANQRRDFLHKLSHALVDVYGLIGLEDLQIDNMVRNHRLSKSILDSGWGYLQKLLTYKAEEAGVSVVLVNPQYTSMTCSNDGYVWQDLTLKDRWVDCPRCGLSMNRDVNAALNILKRALDKHRWDASAGQNVGGCAERVLEAARL